MISLFIQFADLRIHTIVLNNDMVWVYTLFCVHTVPNVPPIQLVDDDTGIHSFAHPTRWKAYFAELEAATPDTLPHCYSRYGCTKFKLMKKNSSISISEYKGPRVPRMFLFWNTTAFPNITKAMAGDYVCENEYGMAQQSYQLNVVGK